MAKKAQDIKVVLVGSGDVGKTSLILRKLNGAFPPGEDLPEVVDGAVSCELTVNNQRVSLQMWDSCAKEDYDRLRPICYPGTSVFLVCYSVVDPESLNHVRSKWVPELLHHVPNCSILVCGCKTDLRDNPKITAALQKQGLAPITTEQGQATVSKIENQPGRLQRVQVTFAECSAFSGKGVNEIFEQAIKMIVTTTAAPPPSRRFGCLLF